jgi:hypothetical protein
MVAPVLGSVRLARPNRQPDQDGVPYYWHPAFDDRGTLLTSLVTKVYLVVQRSDGPEQEGTLVGIRLSLKSAVALAKTYSAGEVHKFSGAK